MHVLLWESVALLGHFLHSAAVLGLVDLSQFMILDVGSKDWNGNSLSALESILGKKSEFSYVGMDTEAGDNVDVVCEPAADWPFEAGSFDVVISTSALEHDRFFWSTFLSMARVVRDEGIIFVNVPSTGSVHRYPIDAWRFYPDAPQALAEWAQQEGENIHLVHSEIMNTEQARQMSAFEDHVMIFAKRPLPPNLDEELLKGITRADGRIQLNARKYDVAKLTSEGDEDLAGLRELFKSWSATFRSMYMSVTNYALASQYVDQRLHRAKTTEKIALALG
ncbi:hypothetical protein B484DRAFT_161315 [Ochromonadaceae sp. CCMP2298]|nr:hypothetical protein B484DRAFT_161315 [Ochromonadaceae sp. CCMP2298]|mmetsp:Transcript_16651/g.36943  ORF Transcript_16651/g.36943 Transcript_16651/m.36943 type:complete len:279 (-) Transcript_16651:31-867(-)